MNIALDQADNPEGSGEPGFKLATGDGSRHYGFRVPVTSDRLRAVEAYQQACRCVEVVRAEARRVWEAMPLEWRVGFVPPDEF